jgi:hypothetical protein
MVEAEGWRGQTTFVPHRAYDGVRSAYGFLRGHFLSILIFLTALYAYTSTLAPTVIEGDAALYQFTPHILGVTYPTGFPLYILLGKLWIMLFPFGEIAWRMNLLSALCSAAALPLLYNATYRLLQPFGSAQDKPANPSASLRTGPPTFHLPTYLAALTTSLIFATIPTFWRWSTEAKTYSLSILLFAAVLYTLGRALEKSQLLPANPEWPATNVDRGTWNMRHLLHRPRPTVWPLQFPLALPALLLGLQIAVHNNAVLLLPGFAAMVWLNFRGQMRRLKTVAGYGLLLALPSLIYLYIPLRAEWLIARFGRQAAIEHGYLADFYHSGLAGLIRYFTAAEFTGGVVTNWGLVPEKFLTFYLPKLLLEEFHLTGVVLGVIGGLGLAFTQPRRFVPLLLWYTVPIPFVLVYNQGEQSAFLLPSFLIFAIFAGSVLTLAPNLLLKFQLTMNNEQLAMNHEHPSPPPPLRLRSGQALPPSILPSFHPSILPLYLFYLTPLLILGLILPLLILPNLQHNLNWLTRKWSREIYNEWADALDHPLEANAGMLAHWGDLTSFWYMQHAEGRRPDLRGVYPPTEENVIAWFTRGNNNTWPELYISGPLQGWAGGIQERYHLIPWGRLVRIAPYELDPRRLLPKLRYPQDAVFGDRLRLLGADFEPQAVSGRVYPVTLTWQALAELPPRSTVSLRLAQGDGIVAQLDDALRSGWFPSETLPAGQHLLSYVLVPVPLGTLPGEYRLQLAVYESPRRPWLQTEGSPVLDLGQVKIISPAANDRPALPPLKSPPHHNFDGEIELVGYDYSVARVGQGKGFGLDLLWQAHRPPADNYTLHLEAVDGSGHVLRTIKHKPVSGRTLTSNWQAGQFIRDLVNVTVPASAPPGEAALHVRLSWLRPDGSRLRLRRWYIPLDTGLDLESLAVTEKEDRRFTPPAIRYPLTVNLDNQAKLIGFNTNLTAVPDGPTGFRLNSADCPTEGCSLAVEFYWQALSEMDQPYQVFFHLVNSAGQIVMQQDRAPGPGGKEPTTGWLPGEVVCHPIDLTLPPDLPAGRYTLRLGLYRPPAGPRLFARDAAGQPTTIDYIDAATIEVTGS